MLSKLTWDGFNAEARIQKDRDKDIRDASAGFESGKIVPAAAALIEAVLSVRRRGEPVRDALERADTSAELDALVTSATARGGLRDYESRLVRAWTVVGGATLGLQITGLALMINPIADQDLLSGTVTTIAIVGVSAASAVLVAALILVRYFNRLLTRAIRDGKDAAGVA